jgi:hypothetical protein
MKIYNRDFIAFIAYYCGCVLVSSFVSTQDIHNSAMEHCGRQAVDLDSLADRSCVL